MKKTSVIACLLVFLAASPAGWAIDRSAKSIDVLSLDAAGYDDIDTVAGTLSVENVLAAKSEKWALVAQMGYGQWDPDVGGKESTWLLGLGIKYYLMPVTSLSLVGSYRGFESGDSDITAGTLTIVQKLVPPSFDVCPYIIGSASLQDIDFSAGFVSREGDSFSAVVLTLGAGIDFMATDELAFVFQGGFSASDDFDDGVQYADGFFFSAGMKYYWF